MPLTEMKSYTGRQEVPSDFDEFWDQNLSKLSSSYEYKLTPMDFGLPNLDCYELRFKGTNDATVFAKCVFPKNKSNIPVVFTFHGYMGQSPDWSDLFQYPAVGYGIVAMDVRGQQGKSTDPQSVIGNTVKGQIIRGATAGRDQLFFKDVYLDVYSIVEIIASLSFVDETNLSVFGGSQGGALSLVAAALNPRIKRAAVFYPFLSDFKRVLEVGNRDEPYDELFRYFKFSDPFHKTEDTILHTLSYIDVKNMAHRIKASVKLFTGLEDQVCFPSTQFAMFNRLSCEKEMVLLPEYGHEDLHVMVNDSIFDFLTGFDVVVKTQLD